MKKDPGDSVPKVHITVTAEALDLSGRPLSKAVLKSRKPEAHAAYKKMGRSLKRLFSQLTKKPPADSFFDDVKKIRQQFAAVSGLGLKVQVTLRQKNIADKITLSI